MGAGKLWRKFWALEFSARTLETTSIFFNIQYTYVGGGGGSNFV